MSWNSWILPTADFSVAPWPIYTVWQFTGGDMDHNVIDTTEEGWLKFTKPDVDVQVTAKPAITEAGPRPKAKKWVNDLGDVWYSEKGAFATGGTIDLRCGARTSSKVVAQLPANTEVRYDAHNRHGGRAWIRQPRSNGYGCLVCRTGNEPWGTFK